MFKKILVAGLSTLLSVNALADAFYTEELPLVWSSIITLSGGVAWATVGQNQYLYPFAYPQYEYYNYNSDTSTLGTGEIFFGLQRIVYPNVIGQLGIGIAGVSDATATGVTTVDGIPDAYSYQYKVNHARVELKGKLIANSFQLVQPYISGSFGAGFNNSHEYRPFFTSPQAYLPWFESNTNIAFSYTLGAGVQTMLTPNWQVGVGYQFADLGKSFLGGDDLTPQRLTEGLGLTHLYTNELLFSVSYLF